MGEIGLKKFCDNSVSTMKGGAAACEAKVEGIKTKIVGNKILNWLFTGEGSYYFWLAVVSVTGFSFLMCRARLGVDLTDDCWYTSDPVIIANGSTPYVNHWTQAAGFALPLFVLYKLFLALNGGTEGIFMFTRILYCVWKTLSVALTFVLLKKAGLKLHPILALPVIYFNSFQLFAVNYNTIGPAYMFLVTAIVYVAMSVNGKEHSKKKFAIALVGGVFMGRCVIATPTTVIGCLVIMVFLCVRKEWKTLKGYITGGVLAAILVVGFCCIRGGTRNFIVGIQYFFRDLSYYDGLKAHAVPFLESTLYVWIYMKPAIAVFTLLTIASLLLKSKKDIFNRLVLLILVVLIAGSVYNLTKYTGQAVSMAHTAKYAWFIPIAAMFFRGSERAKSRLKLLSCLSLINVSIFLLQGYVSSYGFVSRSSWNFLSLVLGVYSAYICFKEIFPKSDIVPHAAVILTGVVISFFVICGSYQDVYRDMPCAELTMKIEEGLWKGCFTTPTRAEQVVKLERTFRSITNEDDEILCWGAWTCFMTLMHNGHHCAPSPLGAGNKNGFDYWHLMNMVPNKIFVRVDPDNDLRADDYEVWKYIKKFYEKTDTIRYLSYKYTGETVYCSIIEYEILDADSALKYADEMATDVYEP